MHGFDQKYINNKKIAIICLVSVAVIIGAVFTIGHFSDKNIAEEITATAPTALRISILQILRFANIIAKSKFSLA